MKQQENFLTGVMSGTRRAFFAVALFSMAINLLMLTSPIYMMQIFDRVLTTRNVDTLIFLSVIAMGAILALALLEWSRTGILVRVSVWLEQKLAPEALKQSIGAELKGASYTSESLMDLDNIRNMISSPTIFSLFDAPFVPLYIGAIFLLHPLLGLIALIAAVILFIVSLINEAATKNPLSLASNQTLKAQRAADQAIRNSETLDAMGMIRAMISNWTSANNAILNLQRLASNRANRLMAFTKFFRLGVQIAILGVGAFLAMDQIISAGAMIAASIILGRALQPVEQSLSSWKQLVSARAAYRRLKQFFDAGAYREESLSLPRPSGLVLVDGLSYAPPGTNNTTLLGVSFTVPAGENLAIVGPSGAGKSTLARLLVGAWKPTRGVARLDNADIFNWNRDDIGRHIGYLPQEVELFSGSIKQNIARLTQGEDEKIIAAAKLAGCHEMILELPQGYETVIGDGGVVLSVGTRQRVALARALYGDPAVVVMDEPNSNLDSIGEAALSAALQFLKQKGTTVILITHRQSALQHADRLMVLNNGKIDMIGPTTEVMAQLTEKSKSARQAVQQQVKTT